MSFESFTCIGPGKTLAYVRADLRTATASMFLMGPWMDDYVAEQMVLAAARSLSVRVLVRPERQVEAAVWARILAGMSIFKNHWRDLEVRTLDRLHAKCLCIDGKIAYVGSANWYRYSLEESLEVMVRGPIDAAHGLQPQMEELWGQGDRLAIPARSSKAVARAVNGITREVLDPIAAQVLEEHPDAFILGRKHRRK